MIFRIMLLAVLASAPAATHAQSAWDGDWVLDPARSSPVAKEAAADGYRFSIRGDRIRWEIPSMAELGEGRLDGRPFALRRPGPVDQGMTLSVRAEGPGVLVYTVARKGRALGDGRMTLVDSGKAWVDLTRGHASPFWGAQVTYVRK